MMNRSDRRGGKPTTRCAFSGRTDDWLPACGFSSWPEASRFKLQRPKIRMQSDPSGTVTLASMRNRDREPSYKGGTEKCSLLTEESRYGVVVQLEHLNHHPVRSIVDASRLFLMSRPPLLARRGNGFHSNSFAASGRAYRERAVCYDPAQQSWTLSESYL
jgi:hypothetical protein